MATRRPSVPKARFTAGIGSAAGKAGDEPVSPSTTADPGSAGSRTSGAGKAGGKAGAKRVRKPASDPNSRDQQDGVVHAAGNSPVPARSFSGRLLVLGLTLGVFTVLLAPNVHTFLQQRAEISQLQAEIAIQETQLGLHETELARWDDPAYIKRQARDRVSMLMPGETGYWVYGANGVDGLDNPAEEAKAVAGLATSAKNATEIAASHWVDNLWGAVQKSAQVQAPAAAPVAPSAEPAPGAEPGAETPAEPGVEPAPVPDPAAEPAPEPAPAP